MLLLFTPEEAMIQARKHEPNEFLRSFLSRSHLLRNASNLSGPRPPGGIIPSLTLVVENWSPYSLVYTAHKVAKGALEQAFPPRNMPEMTRSFGLRTIGVENGRAIENTAGSAGWTLVDPSNGAKVSRVSVAWDVGADRNRFAASLGDFVPSFDEMWQESDTGRLQSRTVEDKNEMIRMADSRTTVVARMRRGSRSDLHRRLELLVVPQKVDVWGWVKYYKEGRESAPPKTRGTTISDNEEKVTSASPLKTPAAGRKKNDPSRKTGPDVEGNSLPLFHRKDLLKEGRSLVDLHDNDLPTLRAALRERVKNHSVAVGFHVENWSRFLLGSPKVEIDSGRLLDGGYLTPVPVKPGEHEVFAVGNDGALSGTGGVIRFSVGSQTGLVLSVMWSVPYNMQFWSTWVAVGLSRADQTPNYKEMYSTKDLDRFVRVKAGREFEFSDGKFIVMAYMDGGTNSKPIVRLGLVPIDEADLAARLRRKLGMPVAQRDDLTKQKRQQEDEASSLLVSAAASGAPCAQPQTRLNWLLVMGMALAAARLR